MVTMLLSSSLGRAADATDGPDVPLVGPGHGRSLKKRHFSDPVFPVVGPTDPLCIAPRPGPSCTYLGTRATTKPLCLSTSNLQDSKSH